ncbi:hypothetical protein P186_0724 [Pyrobaculum ferrireducens]|uniref:Uncharacterized protein n=1 Tax=Pyrobaculum ferrireducens TaxID=1104324 RepID=G7VI82_9CREN|nr:hypothetical protein P186_0724 [Pyrobaculum ferrireducens]
MTVDFIEPTPRPNAKPITPPTAAPRNSRLVDCLVESDIVTNVNLL